ncbi:response regulator [Paenibacillus eucommiae]|uniref:response regulator n=1 Tax=Paenibacillus eucommiae TaxID=1355755 RepID=UPI0028ADAF23|nr:response regulator [Paenibacillus eucommiae]
MVIVDDEDVIREGLKTFVDWNRVGYFVAGEAEDGAMAFELVQDLQPDLVITDIKMPICTGIELMDKLRNYNRDIRIIVLSGYNEFQYATAAIEAGAVGYLLKPIKFDKLHDLLASVKEELDADAFARTRSEYVGKLLRYDFILQLLQRHPANRQEAEKRAAELDMPLAGRCCDVWLAQFDDYNDLTHRYTKDEMESFKLELRETAAEAIRPIGDVYDFPCDDSSLGLLIAGDCRSKDDWRAAASRLLNDANNRFPFRVTLGIGGIFRTIEEVHESYLIARSLIAKKFFLGKNLIIMKGNTSEVPDTADAVSPVPTTLHMERLIVHMQSLEKDKVREYVDEAFASVSSRNEALNVYYLFMQLVQNFMDRFALSNSRLAHLKSPDYQSHKETLAELKDEINQFLCLVVDAMAEGGAASTNSMIGEVKKFIEAQYAHEISLESAARHIHVHPVYLSKIFKKDSGVNFIDYLTEVRVAKAKQFLADTRLKVYKVSEMVGYNDPRHFSKIFKSAVGVTPYEYRRGVLGFLDDPAGSQGQKL